MNNVVRVAIQALAACSAARSRSTPTRWTRRWRSRPRKPRWWRSARSRSSPRRAGVANTVDPLGGSYAVEALTDRSRARRSRTSSASTRWAASSARSSRATRRRRSPKRRIASSSSSTAGEKVMVGVEPLPGRRGASDPDCSRSTRDREEAGRRACEACKAARDGGEVRRGLATRSRGVRERQEPHAARSSTAVKDGVTLGEICDVLPRDVRRVPRARLGLRR